MDYKNEIQELKDKIAKLESKIEEEEVNEVWKPKDDEFYCYMTSDGGISGCDWDNDTTDKYRYMIGNCFKTEKEAEKARDKLILIADLKRFAEENNEGKFNWSNNEQWKYCIFYDYKVAGLRITTNSYVKDAILPYFTSKEIAQKAIDTFKDRLIELFMED